MGYDVRSGGCGGCGAVVSVGMGSIRLPFYLLQLLNLLILKRSPNSYAMVWDELGVLPLPKSSRYLVSQLHQNPTQGLISIAPILGNPFQAWAVQYAAWIHLE